MSVIEIPFGNETWRLDLPAAKRVELAPPGRAASALTPGEQVRDALEQPFDFEPLRRALTPDDHVVVVVDESLPAVAEMVTAVLQHLGTAHVSPESVTLLSPPNSRGGWIDDLPDEYADVHTEVHDPADRKKLAYLATTKGERRVYLNRTLVEAEFVVVLSGRRFDAAAGHGGAEAMIFPALSDEETRAASHTLAESAEVAWLLGTPFFVQVIDDGARVLDVVAGLPGSTAEGARRQDEFWKRSVPAEPDAVVTTVTGDRVTFADVALAALHAAQAAPKGGRVVVLAPPVDLGGAGVAVLRQCDDPREALKQLPADEAAFRRWATAAVRARLFLANVDDDTAEELFGTRVGNERELQRLLETADRVLVLPDGHRTRVELPR